MKKKRSIPVFFAAVFVCILLLAAPTFTARAAEMYTGSVLATSQETFALAKGGKSDIRFQSGLTVKSAEWKSSDTAVASVDALGTVTGKQKGTAVISVSGIVQVTGDGEPAEKEFSDEVTVVVTEPKLSEDSLYLNLYNSYKDGDGFYSCAGNEIVLQGISGYSEVSVRTSSGNLDFDAYRSRDGEDESYSISFYPKKTGTYAADILADGKSIRVTIGVYKIYFARNSKTMADYASKTWVPERSMIALYPGESTALQLQGVPAGVKVKYKSSNRAVAAVDSAGRVTGKGLGYAAITADVNGLQLTYEVGVSYKNAVGALRYASKHYGSVYSQEKRMQKGYYDCSSFAWRSYASANTYLGSKNWAPTAADMAKWCAQNGYMIASGTVDLSRLLPGDLIFLCGTEQNGWKNGRYHDIYHVDIYQGNFMSMTVQSQRSYWSEASDVMVARPCGTNVSGLKASADGYNTIRLSWKKTYGASGCQVYRSTSKKGTYKKIASVKNAQSYTDQKASWGKTYYYKVRSYWKISGKTYKGRFSGIVSKKTAAVKPVVSVSKNARRTVTLKWAKVNGASGYEIYRSAGKGKTYKKIKTIQKGGAGSYTNRSLKKNRTYYYKMKSYRIVNKKKVSSGYSRALKVKVKG